MTLGRYQHKQKGRLDGPTGFCKGETDAATSETHSGYLARSRQADRLSVARRESTRKGWLSPFSIDGRLPSEHQGHDGDQDESAAQLKDRREHVHRNRRRNDDCDRQEALL